MLTVVLIPVLSLVLRAVLTPVLSFFIKWPIVCVDFMFLCHFHRLLISEFYL